MSGVFQYDPVKMTLFKEQLHTKAEQTTSRLSPYCEPVAVKGYQDMAYDAIIPIGRPRKVTQAYTPVEFDTVRFERRQLITAKYVIVIGTDELDLDERLGDPKGTLAMEAMRSMQREKDRIIYAAMNATIRTGRNFEDTITAAQDGVVTVDATGGYTYEKILEINSNFIDNSVQLENDVPLVSGVTGTEWETMMQELELVNNQYTGMTKTQGGSKGIESSLGIDFVRFAAGGPDPILPVVAGERLSFCMQKGAIALGISRDWDVRIEPRHELHGTVQIKIEGRIGAVRTEGARIQMVRLTA